MPCERDTEITSFSRPSPQPSPLKGERETSPLEPVFQLDELRASFPQLALLGDVERRFRRVGAARAFEEPPRCAGVGGGEGQVDQVVRRSVRAARDQSQSQTKRARG